MRIFALVTTRTLEDGALAQRVRSAERGVPNGWAEAELCRRFAERIRLYGLRHLHDEQRADDLVQQVLIVVIERLRAGRLREPERLGSFILGTCRLMARDLRRDESRRQAILDRFALPSEAQLDEPSWNVDRGRLRDCLEKLPARERSVVLLSFFGERDGDEIAAELSMSSGNVRVVRHRAVRHLRACMDGGESRP